MITITSTGNPIRPVTPIPSDAIAVRFNGTVYNVYFNGDTVPPLPPVGNDVGITKYQFYAALKVLNWYDATINSFGKQSDADQIVFNNADVFYRSASSMNSWLTSSGMSSSDIDLLFTTGAALPPAPTP